MYFGVGRAVESWAFGGKVTNALAGTHDNTYRMDGCDVAKR